MKRLCILLMATVLCGCGAHSIPVVDSSGMDEMNSELSGREVTLVTQYGSSIKAVNLDVGFDETWWTDPATGGWHSLPTGTIREVRHHRPGRGVGKGLLYGGGVATVMATMMYWSSSDDPYSSLVFVFFPPLGAIGGMIVGGVAEADVYKLDLAAPQSVGDAEQFN